MHKSKTCRSGADKVWDVCSAGRVRRKRTFQILPVHERRLVACLGQAARQAGDHEVVEGGLGSAPISEDIVPRGYPLRQATPATSP